MQPISFSKGVEKKQFNDMSSRCFCAIFIFHAAAVAFAAIIVVLNIIFSSLSLDFSHDQRSADSRIIHNVFQSHLLLVLRVLLRK